MSLKSIEFEFNTWFYCTHSYIINSKSDGMFRKLSCSNFLFIAISYLLFSLFTIRVHNSGNSTPCTGMKIIATKCKLSLAFCSVICWQKTDSRGPNKIIPKKHILYGQQINVVYIIPLVLIDKKNITWTRSHEQRFEPRSTTQILSNVMK